MIWFLGHNRYNIEQGGSGVSAQNFTDYTAEFLLTYVLYIVLVPYRIWAPPEACSARWLTPHDHS